MITEVTPAKMAKPATQLHIELVSIIVFLVFVSQLYNQPLNTILFTESPKEDAVLVRCQPTTFTLTIITTLFFNIPGLACLCNHVFTKKTKIMQKTTNVIKMR